MGSSHRAIRHPEAATLLPNAVALANQPDRDAIRDQASGRARVKQHAQRLRV